MRVLIDLDSLRRCLIKNRHCRLDTFFVHILSSVFNDGFSSEQMGELSGVPVSRITRGLRNSKDMILVDGIFHASAELKIDFEGTLVQVEEQDIQRLDAAVLKKNAIHFSSRF